MGHMQHRGVDVLVPGKPLGQSDIGVAIYIGNGGMASLVEFNEGDITLNNRRTWFFYQAPISSSIFLTAADAEISSFINSSSPYTRLLSNPGVSNARISLN